MKDRCVVNTLTLNKLKSKVLDGPQSVNSRQAFAQEDREVAHHEDCKLFTTPLGEDDDGDKEVATPSDATFLKSTQIKHSYGIINPDDTALFERDGNDIDTKFLLGINKEYKVETLKGADVKDQAQASSLTQELGKWKVEKQQ